MNISKHDDDDIGSGMGDVKAVALSTATQFINQHGKTNKCADGYKTTETCVNMCNNLRRTISRMQTKIRQEKNKMKMQVENNLGSQFNFMMLDMLTEQMQVAEVYSPPRVAEMANQMGMRGGWSLDLTPCDTDGMPWDFNNANMRNRAVRKLLNDKPIVFIGSPMCTEYSTIIKLNHSKMAPEEVEQRMAYARKHVEFCITLYEIQWRSGR